MKLFQLLLIILILSSGLKAQVLTVGEDKEFSYKSPKEYEYS